MNLSIERIEVLLLIASVVAMLVRKLRLPYTVGLVLAGAALAVLPHVPDIRLTKTLIFNAFLPPLLFEAAIQMPWRALRRDLPVILLLATGGVLLSAGLTAWGLHGVTGWPWATALLLGVLLSATDPVSVLATFKEAGVQGRLRLLVEAESLFNDGTVAVLFSALLAAGGQATALTVGGAFLQTLLGGILCGAVVGALMLALARRTNDHLVEITFTTVASYGSFLLAEHFHLSGVLATLTAGLVVGNIGPLGALSRRGRAAVVDFWEFAAFVANSLIFLLIGMRLPHYPLGPFWRPALAAIVLVTAGRALAVYVCCLPFRRSAMRVPARHQHVLFWGGLRGALALALVLGLPPDQPQRGAIIVITFAVVAFSVIVQGATITPLLRRQGEILPAPAASGPFSGDEVAM